MRRQDQRTPAIQGVCGKQGAQEAQGASGSSEPAGADCDAPEGPQGLEGMVPCGRGATTTHVGIGSSQRITRFG